MGVLSFASGTLVGSGFGSHDRDLVFNGYDKNFIQLDDFTGLVTGALGFSLFSPVTGSVADFNVSNGDAGSGFIGAEFNRASDRIIQEVIGYVSASGSNPAAVCRIDVQVQQGAVMPANYSSIFGGNANKLAISGSAGLGPSKAANFVSGTMVWPKGTILHVVCDLQSGLQTGLGAMRGLTVQIFWKPVSQYYGS